MIIHTAKFGEIEVDETKKIIFNEGIPGFEHLKAYMILEDGDGVFYYLKSLEDGNIAFPIINPHLIKKDYAPHIHESYFEKLGGGESEAFSVFVITTIRENMADTTVNLQAPLLIHTERRVGVQTIIEDKCYQSRHKLMDLLQERGE